MAGNSGMVFQWSIALIHGFVKEGIDLAIIELLLDTIIIGSFEHIVKGSMQQYVNVPLHVISTAFQLF